MKRTKRRIALLMAVALVFSGIQYHAAKRADAEESTAVTVTLRIETDAETMLAPIKVTMTQEDKNNDFGVGLATGAEATYSPLRAFAKYLASQKQVSNEDMGKYIIASPSYYGGLWVQGLSVKGDGIGAAGVDAEVSWLYSVNGESGNTSMDMYSCDSKDEVVIYGSYYHTIDPTTYEAVSTEYAEFDRTDILVKAGEKFAVTLNARGDSYDASGNATPYKKPVAGATVYAVAAGNGVTGATAENAAVTVQTDAKGKAELSFASEGVYLLSAGKLTEDGVHNLIARPYASVRVLGAKTCFVTQSRTPVQTEKGGTVWTHSFATDGKSTCNSLPIITGKCIYLVSKNVLYAVDYEGNILREKLLSAAMDSICYLEYADGKLWIPLSGGRMECVDTESFDTLWVSESFGGQSLSHVTYYEGAVYAGTTEMKAGNETDGVFYCLDAQTGATRWTYRNTQKTGGYYWSGSCVVKDRLYFAGDNGILVEHDLLSEQVYSESCLSATGKIRSDLQYDADSQSLYAISTLGELCFYSLAAGTTEGVGGALSVWKLFPDSRAVNCTSTPTIVDGTAYFGAIADGMGYLCVWDLSEHQMRYTVETGLGCEVKATPLVSTAYGQSRYIYYTCNRLPGGVYFIEDRNGAASGKQYTLYEPAVAKQYCMASIVSGPDGVLYYSNDSGTLFAVSEVERSSDYIEPSATAKPSANPPAATKSSAPKVTQKPKSTAKVGKPQKPKNVRVSRTKKGVRIRWSKGSGATKTIVYGKSAKGKWKKIGSTKKSSFLWKKKGRKKLQIRLRSAKRYQNRWIYSGYTKIKQM